ncbi:membrane protein [Mycolicibacterium madagascariense]|uniref:Membrane protein n=1 Tax=Mycolicibacterium madagascariense TaxID=212765 RepID=A0A7I7X824_9MYCO|nr:hypothetical protein [Mycolicibacterium madagascariense]MCV7012740.1 hypothetical protein [Mycolicibacterium madagascariense]BBZ25999.1 membrane protein [Mycolicibacterium madagascariense]
MTGRPFASRVRWWLGACGGNPIVRRSDRVEALVVLAALVLAILAVPFAAHVEDSTYRSHLHLVAEQEATRHSVQAVVLQGSTGMPTDFDAPVTVPVQWHEGNRVRTEEVVSPGVVATGAPLTVWLDTAGRVVPAPLTPTDVRVSAISVGWTVWVLIVIAGGLAAVGVRWRLDRHRATAWDRALALLAHNDDGWANRRA